MDGFLLYACMHAYTFFTAEEKQSNFLSDSIIHPENAATSLMNILYTIPRTLYTLLFAALLGHGA